MGGPRATRLQVGSAPWITEERSSASQIAQDEIEEFSFSARNEFEWLNEHMAEVFSENQINVADIFKTPGKLRGKTPRTARKFNAGEARVPLSDIFSATPKGARNPFAAAKIDHVQSPRIKVAVDAPVKAMRPASPKHAVPALQPSTVVDSGYHGSQSQDAMDVDEPEEPVQPSSPEIKERTEQVAFESSPQCAERSPTHPSPEATTETAGGDHTTQYFTAKINSTTKIEAHESTTPVGSPVRVSKSTTASPTTQLVMESAAALPDHHANPINSHEDASDEELDEPSRSPSDGSSPIRPIVRKSSLNFASLPAREPITHKTNGNRISRVSHLDQNRTSYYGRQTGGKSLGNVRHEATDDEMDDMDEEPVPAKSTAHIEFDNAATHNKTYTQRLQDQISKLGQTQANASRPSKSIPNILGMQQPAAPTAPEPKVLPSPKPPTTPGAFPEDDDDDDDWIQPLGPPDNASSMFSPRPTMPKSFSADVVEGVAGKSTISGHDFAVPKTRQPKSRSKSPQRPEIPERTTSTLGHHKSASVPALPQMLSDMEDTEDGHKKTISVSNPTLPPVVETDGLDDPPKSPSRSFRDSPLKQVKNKLSSILKSSKGLLASSAAISAEGKSSLISPSTTRLGLLAGPSTESLAQPLYPDLSRQVTESAPSVTSPTRTDGRRTRASLERERAEEKRRKEEAKEAKRLADQMDKLEKAREKEREKARVFSKEQERVAAMEKQVTTQKEQDKKAVAATPSQPPRATRVSPRRAKAQPDVDERPTTATSDPLAGDDVEMVDAPGTMPPPSVPRSAAPKSQIKRPVKPTKEAVSKSKQAPTVIRVNTGSQHSQYQPSNNVLASNLHETLAAPTGSQPQLKSKASQASLQGKPSLQSLKSSTSSAGRPKALELAAKRKEQEEREAQRKRDAKAEMERKRAALQEEERRQEQQRRQEVEKQREEERKLAADQAEAKKSAQRQAMLEKAKQTRAPPPAARPQPNGAADLGQSQRGEPSRPPSRMNSLAHRSQEDLGRSVNAAAANNGKAASKRVLNQENSDHPSSRMGNTYQGKDSKRMRMTEEFDDVDTENQPSLKGAPVRPSGAFKKDLPSKAILPPGYANMPQNGSRDLFKTTITNQHNSQVKTAHPLDMAQVSKAAIPFAPNPNPAGPSTSKTPARPIGMAAKSAAKSANRSSPRFQNGEAIELPEIDTDDEDEYDNGGGKEMFASWTDSPALRRALMEQEGLDPFQVFGAPGPLNMEEVFAKSKERFHKFRQRTSSANWSGTDRLTEDDIRKDLAARDKMRREGGWSYEMGRDLA